MRESVQSYNQQLEQLPNHVKSNQHLTPRSKKLIITSTNTASTRLIIYIEDRDTAEDVDIGRTEATEDNHTTKTNANKETQALV